jgi:hypothetical protein
MLRYTLLGVGSTGVILLEGMGFLTFTLACWGWAVRTIDRAG